MFVLAVNFAITLYNCCTVSTILRKDAKISKTHYTRSIYISLNINERNSDWFCSEKLVCSSGVDLVARAKDLECGESRSRFSFLVNVPGVRRGTPKRNSNFETGSRFAAMRTITPPPAGYDRVTI